MLDPGSATEAPEPGEAGQLRLSGQFDFEPGDIVAMDAGPETPHGLLAKVVSVDDDGSATNLQVVPATLPEALPEGSFSGQIDPEPVGSEALGLAGPEAQATDGVRQSSEVGTQKTFECDSSGDFSVTGDVDLDSRIDVSGSWGPFSGPKARFVGHMDATGELELEVAAEVSCSVGPKTLFFVPLGAVTFFAGPVPVVLVPAVSASLSGEVAIDGSVRTGASGAVTVEAGVDYHDGQAHPVGQLDATLSGGSPPDPSGSGHAGATLSPAISVLIYGVGGPQAAINAGLSLDASLGEEPPWTLTAPVSATASIAIPALNIGSPQLTIWEETHLLAQG